MYVDSSILKHQATTDPISSKLMIAIALAIAMVCTSLVPMVEASNSVASSAEPTIERYRDLVFGSTTSASADEITVVTTSRMDGGQATAVIDARPANDAIHFDMEALVPGADQMLMNSDGSVAVLDSAGAHLSTVEIPWAVDANGASIGTSYTASGTILTQHLELAADTAYPVTADPRFHWSWGRLYVTWYRGEALWLNGLTWVVLAAAVGTLCAGPHVALCAAAVAGIFYTLYSISDWAVGRMYDRGCKLETRLIPWPNTKWKC